MATEQVKGKTTQEALQVTHKAFLGALLGRPPATVLGTRHADKAFHAALWYYAELHYIHTIGRQPTEDDTSECAAVEDY